jgi:hypothetical protein
LAALEKNQFEKTRLRYPIDLGQTDKAHYLVHLHTKTRNSKASGESTPTGFTGMQPQLHFRRCQKLKCSR